MSSTHTQIFAFPSDEGCANDPGMELLDYFAGQIVMELISKYNLKKPEDQQIISAMSYELAATMLEERKKYIN